MKAFSAYAFLVFLVGLLYCMNPLRAQQPHDVSSPTGIAGEWLFTVDYFNNPLEQPIIFINKESTISARFVGDTTILTVMQKGDSLKIVSNQSDGSKTEYDGIFRSGEANGTVMMYDPLIKDTTISQWKATKLNMNAPVSPHLVDFTPNGFQRGFSAIVPPVLHIWPDDTIHTESVDAGGMDKNGKRRVLGGNPLTGPFYVETALPGDVLAVTITRLQLNRPWAISTQGIVDRGLTIDYSQNHKISFDGVRWNLDLQKGMAYPEKPHEHMKNYAVAVKPMLGCVGVAPWFGSQPITTGDSGPFGGNMDFNNITEGATVYLPVYRAGALLYLGDAHALQGDGELTGDALETSMDIQFKVKVIKDTSIHIGTPRVENAESIMAVGLSGSLDNAFREATSELAGWLQQNYKLTPEEIAQVFGTAIEYNICEVADRNVGVVARIKKSILARLNK
jgi:acetamidase/formamidase